MADPMVFETQKWLNATYGKVAGFEKAPLNGRTGWKTIYSLREALQHELGLKQLGEGFGDVTKNALAKVMPELKVGYKGKIVKLIKGAFWCKGISSGAFTEKYDTELEQAIKELQGDAGLKKDGRLTVNLMAAIFDMSAFVLVLGGDKKIRQMQQDLNARYSSELGVMPCDGIYQRDTNKALIYALQRTLGMPVDVANGNYGPGTIKKTPTVANETHGYIVKIIQYGLYVNGFYSGNFDESFNSAMDAGIIAFRKFMNLPPFTALADLTLIKGLLTSNGNTERDSDTCDASKQLTATDIANFKRFGFKIVGRYLTGSVGVGKDKRPKNLTVAEIKRIADGGLRLFPIYEDGGYEVEYFSGDQGVIDAQLALNAARKLGFPKGTTIYFAVDVDVQEGEIAAGIEPYISALVQMFTGSEYAVGLYGTRNVCLHGEKLGVKSSFVADMSYGWSGNLGFKMPKNWAFDQFAEYPIGGTPIDQDASSGRDQGVVITAFPKVVSPKAVLKDIGKTLNVAGLEFGKEVTVPLGPFAITVEVKTELEPKNGTIFTIENGKLSANISDKMFGDLGLEPVQSGLIMEKLDEVHFVSKISAGNVAFEHSVGPDGTLDITMTFNIQKYEDAYLEETLAVVFGLKVPPSKFPDLGLDPVTAEEPIPEAAAIVLIVAAIWILTGGLAFPAFIAFLVSLGVAKHSDKDNQS